ncbi:MAG: hypothetical protein IKE23_12950, partial [Exiguobacterium sp.]|nr:hypothetical protein [Exiguobacterium sp.]
DEVDAWTEALPKGMTILGAMQVLENYNKPFIPNAKDFIEAGSDMYDSLMAQAFCKKQGITIEELLERQRETFWGGTR